VRVKLLHRDARKVTLTPAGRRFYEAVAGAVDSIDLPHSIASARWLGSRITRRLSWAWPAVGWPQVHLTYRRRAPAARPKCCGPSEQGSS
jgi:hypothetical protein